MTISAHDVARELRKRLPGVGVLKLHKLLYYCQGWHLAWTGEPMFFESIEAWDNGPVVSDLWHDEDKHRAKPAEIAVDASALATMGYVLARYGGLSGPDLIRLTHAEQPWRATTEDTWSSSTIRIDAMADFFRRDEENALTSALADSAFGDQTFVALVNEHRGAKNRDDPEEIRKRLALLQR